MYIGSGLIYSFGMLVIGITGNKFCAIMFSLCAGIQYSTLFTMPYLLIAKYQVYNVVSFLSSKTFLLLFQILSKNLLTKSLQKNKIREDWALI
jgi:K+-sensing histidine kinase KdpD